jgi:hypothetical protein
VVVKQGDVISYLKMCMEEGVNLRRGMNFRLRKKSSVILMSLRPDAQYADRVEDNGRVLIYEGHDVGRESRVDPKTIDQPLTYPNGKPTQNALFLAAAERFKAGQNKAELVKVYEKIRPSIWVYNGLFRLIDGWQESSDGRQVFKFKLEMASTTTGNRPVEIEHNRIIPTSVKVEVWNRDKGRCVKCGRTDNLHFDHIIPYSKGGSSLVADNIQILCARHNLEKLAKIE